MDNTDNKKPFKVAKWIMLSFAVILNSFIIFYSCLDDKTTNDWSRFVSNIFTNIVNGFTHKEVKVIPVTGINASFSDNALNNVDGYELEEIPLGCEKEITATILPENASNKAVSYSTDNKDIISLKQSGSKVSVIGLKTGTATIKAESSDKSFSKQLTIKVVNLVAPLSFDASIHNTSLAIGDVETVKVTVTNAFDSELTNSLYYDTYQLSYRSDNDEVATIGKYGVITPISEGNTTIRVSNSSGVEKLFNITITSGTPAPAYEDLKIIGNDYCYENDIFNNKKIDLTVKNGEQTLDNSDFIWESSNPVLLNVNQNGEVRGYRKTSLEDETVVVKAINKKTHQEITKDIVIKKELPTKMYTCYVVGKDELWDHPKVTTFVGDVITVRVSYDKVVANYNTSVVISDESIASYTNKGTNIILEFKKEGSVDVTITSEIVPSLTNTTAITVMKAGAIGQDDVESVHKTIRKSIGHALMFAITQVFTFLALYMFLPKMKWWQVALISLGAGILLASVSELIQFFIPLRSGTFVDVLVDLAGVTTGLVITLGLTLLIKSRKNKKSQSEVAKD